MEDLCEDCAVYFWEGVPSSQPYLQELYELLHPREPASRGCQGRGEMFLTREESQGL